MLKNIEKDMFLFVVAYTENQTGVNDGVMRESTAYDSVARVTTLT